MTIDELLQLAGDVSRIHGKYGPPGNQAEKLARAILAILVVDKPCGYSAEFVVNIRDDGRVYIEMNNALTADEAQWAAVEIMRAVERARKERGNG